MCLVHNLDDFGVSIAYRIGCPAILKIDVALAVHVPDEVAFSFVDHDLVGAAHATPAGLLHLLFETQAVLE